MKLGEIMASKIFAHQGYVKNNTPRGSPSTIALGHHFFGISGISTPLASRGRQHPGEEKRWDNWRPFHIQNLECTNELYNIY